MATTIMFIEHFLPGITHGTILSKIQRIKQKPRNKTMTRPDINPRIIIIPSPDDRAKQLIITRTNFLH